MIEHLEHAALGFHITDSTEKFCKLLHILFTLCENGSMYIILIVIIIMMWYMCVCACVPVSVHRYVRARVWVCV